MESGLCQKPISVFYKTIKPNKILNCPDKRGGRWERPPRYAWPPKYYLVILILFFRNLAFDATPVRPIRTRPNLKSKIQNRINRFLGSLPGWPTPLSRIGNRRSKMRWRWQPTRPLRTSTIGVRCGKRNWTAICS